MKPQVKCNGGNKYREKHKEIYVECYRILKENGVMIVNISNHIRKGQIVNVVEWHKQTLISLGLKFIDEIKIETPRMKYGENGKKRVEFESILVFNKN